jgi:alanine-synthesizing transaminase
MFSSRLPARLSANALTEAIDARKRAGVPLVDLTETNPTAVGLPYPASLLSSLGDPAGARYRPDPRGLATAREAIAAEYRGDTVRADRLVLTASSSEAYAWLFKLLCDPGDDVLVPQPSYPLFDLLTTLESVPARAYRLDEHGHWTIDRASLERAATPRTRAVLVVSPNNPTGSMLQQDDREWLAAWCASRKIAIISDEVFADYPIAPRAGACSMAGETRALTFVLGGLSKSIGLPQVKLGWIAVSGPETVVADALDRLEIIADTFLSVSTPVQLAAPTLLREGRAVREAIRARVRHNLETLVREAARWPAITVREPEGGWTAVIDVPAFESEDALAMRILDEAGAIVHPGYFFDFSREAKLVVSLLPEPAVFSTAIARVLACASGPRS